MTPSELLGELRRRYISVTARGTVLDVRPGSHLTGDERTLLAEHRLAMIALLTPTRNDARDVFTVEPTSTLDEILTQRQEAHDRAFEEQHGPRRVVRFRTRNTAGWAELEDLSLDDVRSLERNGKITPDEVRRWARLR